MDNNNETEDILFTSESVGEGHPDKTCDQISDAILDACLKEDKKSKVAVETAMKGNSVMVLGEITTNAKVDYVQIVKKTLETIGYDDEENAIDFRSCHVHVAIQTQAPDIAQKVHIDKAPEDVGAGDQGMMFGYATDETEEMMPLTIMLAHKLNRKLSECRRDGSIKWLRPDSKTQVTVQYRKKGNEYKPVFVHTVVISAMHQKDVPLDVQRKELKEKVVKAVIPADLLRSETIYHLQPGGAFIQGGPKADAGLTGRKIIVDTYGGWGAHGGGAFSGKDPTKVDRSASYAARWIAKSIVHSKLAKKVLIQVSYAIGLPDPLAIFVDTYGTGKKSNDELAQLIKRNFNLRPGVIIKDLQLDQPIYQKTACYGHFGRDPKEFTWENPKLLKY